MLVKLFCLMNFAGNVAESVAEIAVSVLTPTVEADVKD